MAGHEAMQPTSEQSERQHSPYGKENRHLIPPPHSPGDQRSTQAPRLGSEACVGPGSLREGEGFGGGGGARVLQDHLRYGGDVLAAHCSHYRLPFSPRHARRKDVLVREDGGGGTLRDGVEGGRWGGGGTEHSLDRVRTPTQYVRPFWVRRALSPLDGFEWPEVRIWGEWGEEEKGELIQGYSPLRWHHASCGRLHSRRREGEERGGEESEK